MPDIPFKSVARLPADELARVREQVAAHEGLVQIFAWGRQQTPPIHPADVVKQDEFTHDVLVPFPNDRWVVYGTT